MVWSNFPDVVCQCCRQPLAFTEMITFFVTAWLAAGLHLIWVVGIGCSISVFKIYDYLPVKALKILMEPSPQP